MQKKKRRHSPKSMGLPGFYGIENCCQAVGGNENAKHFPNRHIVTIFYKEIGEYEVYYLQISADTANNELSAVQSHMAKGIRRIAACYHREDENINAYLVYEASFAKWLKERQQEEKWQEFWNLPLYGEYKESHNLTLLLQQIPKSRWPGRLIILGEAPGMQEWIGTLARYMRGITIFSPVRPRCFESIREKLLDEYGLLISWEKSLQPVSGEPALVLDYCGKEKIYIWGIPSGSIWIDMMSMEERRHSLEDRETGIDYISLKSFWKGEMLQTLDTASKIQYNTEVKL